MTYEKSLKHYEEKVCRFCRAKHCENCPTATAKTAMEKQIPKKPISITISGISRYKSGACKCGTAIVMAYKCCPSCGQAINWSEGE